MTNKRNQSGFNGIIRSIVAGKDKKEAIEQLREKTAHWCYLMDAHPTSSTVIALERWGVLEVVRVLLAVVGGRGRTTTVQGHVVRKEELVVVSVEMATGLVPGFAGYPSSTTVELERMVVVVVMKARTHLSDDKDVVEDMGSELEGSKRWDRGV